MYKYKESRFRDSTCYLPVTGFIYWTAFRPATFFPIAVREASRLGSALPYPPAVS